MSQNSLVTHDTQYMLRALNLALKGKATVSPNPLVGAVIVKDGLVIGEGYHERKGEPHAEVNAINSASASLEGSTLYCSLEPCCHTNKTTPPCVKLILKSNFKRVVVGSLDPNPEVSGKGVETLRKAGLEVVTGVLKERCEKLNTIFHKNMEAKAPFIHLKAACTLDGRMASRSGSSKWITSEEARKEVHELRVAYDAVMIGKNTLISDTPKLTARVGGATIKEPIKIVVGDLDSNAMESAFFKESKRVINIYNKLSPSSSIDGLTAIKKKNSWKEGLEDLFKMGINSILVEGGPTLLSSFLDEGTFDRLSIYFAPKLIGNGPSILSSEKTLDMENVSRLKGAWRLLKTGEAVFEVGA